MPFCENCGNKVSETSKFCVNCGFQLKSGENTSFVHSDLHNKSIIANPNEANTIAVETSITLDGRNNDTLEEKVNIIKKRNPFYKTFLFWFWIVMAMFYYTSSIGWWGETMSGEIGSKIFIRIFVGVNALYFANKFRGNSKK